MSEATQERPTDRIDPRMTVNQVIERFPGTLPVFDRHGIDSCCGGALPLASAAERHGIQPGELVDELEARIDGGG